MYGYGSSLAARYDLHDNAFYSSVADASLTTSPTITYGRNFYGGGAATSDNGGRDYIGTRLYQGAPDTGAVEYRT